MESYSQFQHSRQRREREVLRYLPKFDWSTLPSGIDDLGQGPRGQTLRPLTFKSSIDKALHAFAQLGALQMGVRRAMISLIDRDNQYIIAESTKPLSSQTNDIHGAGDSLLLGVRVIGRTQGICGHALTAGFQRGGQTQDRGGYYNRESATGNGSGNMRATVFHDLTEEEQFKDHPFVLLEPKTRFYAAVPIQTVSGHMIGSYCVMDDNPRSGVRQDQLEFLQDMASSVMEHLEFVALRGDHERAAKMLKGLGLFAEGRSSISEWWLRTNDSNKASGSHIYTPESAGHSQSKERSLTSTKDNELLSHQRTERSLAFNPSENTKLPLRPSKELSNQPKEEKQDIPSTPETAKNMPQSTQQSGKSRAEVKSLFSRASNLIRESTGVDGAIFFDAGLNGFGAMRETIQVGGDRRGSEPSSNGEKSSGLRWTSDTNETSSGVESTSKSSSSRVPASSRFCDVLGFSTANNSSLNGHEAANYHLTVADEFVQKILRRYPHGKIFAFDEVGGISSSEEDTLHSARKGITLDRGNGESEREPGARKKEAQTILQIFPGSRFIMIFPLWDPYREKWYATTMLWTSDPSRVLTAEDDMSYLASFGNNIMTEIARLETTAENQAKNTFISSISHELRSPLHGIMGSVELLRETLLSYFQLEAIDAIKQCSVTLLDTLNHVLDFAKINNFVVGNRKKIKLSKRGTMSRKARPAESISTYGAISLASDFSLDVMAEEVVQAIYLGHFQAQPFGDTSLADQGPGSDRFNNIQQSVLVILDVDWNEDWRFHSQSGAWRRILMNLFGNALKYTTTGFITVRLEYQKALKNKPRRHERTAILTVSDTGKGVSPSFVENRIFAPFAQEDTLSPGTGLGLSIVRQIVESLHGKIDFDSTVGLGTSVKITIPIGPVKEQDSVTSKNDEVVARARAFVQKKKLALVVEDGYGSLAHTEGNQGSDRGASIFQGAFTRMVQQCFDMEVVTGTNVEQIEADIYVLAQAHFEKLPKDDVQRPVPGSAGGRPVIVITTSVRATEQSKSDLPKATLSHPIGPRRFANAILSIENHFRAVEGLQEMSSTIDSTSRPPVEPAPSPKDQPKPAIISSPPPEDSRENTGRPRLLLVEDNAINMKLLATQVRKLGYPFDTATDGSLALAHYKKSSHKPAVIFMDISMPVMDGFTATRLIRAHEAEEKLPAATIIALTGLASAEAQQESYSSGINLFLSKPVPMKEIQKILQSLDLGQ